MITSSCDICDNITDNRIYYILCDNCLKCNISYTKGRIKEEFLLSDKDLANLKYIPDKSSKKYILKDINKLILSKFGSYKNYNIHMQKKKDMTTKIKLKRERNKIERRKRLITELGKNKIAFKNYGYCYSYINYGKPDINIVIKKELEKEHEKTKRKLRLSGELSKLDIRLDESLESCYNYINDIGEKDIKNTVRAVEIEYFLKYETDYPNLKKIYDENTARQIAVSKYYKKNNKICNDYK